MPLLQIRIIFQTAACCFIKCFLDFCRCMDFTTPPRRPFPVKFPRKVSLVDMGITPHTPTQNRTCAINAYGFSLYISYSIYKTNLP